MRLPFLLKRQVILMIAVKLQASPLAKNPAFAKKKFSKACVIHRFSGGIDFLHLIFISRQLVLA